MNNIEFTDVVLDVRIGDVGKACISYDLLKTKGHNLCVKFNGGPNAGNTIYINTNDNNYPITPLTQPFPETQPNQDITTPNYKKMVLGFWRWRSLHSSKSNT